MQTNLSAPWKTSADMTAGVTLVGTPPFTMEPEDQAEDAYACARGRRTADAARAATGVLPAFEGPVGP